MLSWHNRQVCSLGLQLAVVGVAVGMLAIAPPVAVLIMAGLVASVAGLQAVAGVVALGVLVMALLR